MHFTKMQGIGNDYIYIDCTEIPFPDPDILAPKLSDRHFGIGGDGIVLISLCQDADFAMQMFNADGSESAMCGNASRCIGKYVYERGLTHKTDLLLKTGAGIKKLHLNVKNGIVRSVCVDMGIPLFKPAEIPVLSSEEHIISQ